VTCFDLVGHPQARQENRSKSYGSKSVYNFASVTESCEHLESHNVDKLNNSWICFLGGPEDDRLGRNMSPSHIYRCIYNKSCVTDRHVVFICVLHTYAAFVTTHNIT